MRIWMIIYFLGLGITVNAQQVIHNGKIHEVKGKVIFHEGEDITSSLHTDERESIFKKLKKQLKEDKNAEKAINQRENDIKKAQKSQSKAEKALKQKQKANDKFNMASKKLNQNQDKYQKLKDKGKLSPNDEAKWLKKLEGFKKDVEKSRRKL